MDELSPELQALLKNRKDDSLINYEPKIDVPYGTDVESIPPSQESNLIPNQEQQSPLSVNAPINIVGPTPSEAIPLNIPGVTPSPISSALNRNLASQVPIPPQAIPQGKSAPEETEEEASEEAPKKKVEAKTPSKSFDIQSLLKDVYGPGLGADALKGAIATKNQNQLLDAIIKGGTQIAGRGLANTSGIDEIMKQAGTPVEDILTQRKGKMDEMKMKEDIIKTATSQQMADSTSDISKLYRDTLAKSGYSVPENASAAQLKEYFPIVERLAANKIQKDYMRDQKSTQMQNQAMDKIMQLTEGSRMPPGVKQAMTDMQNLKKADTIFDRYPNLNDMPKNQVATLMQEVGKIAKGSSPTDQEFKQLYPESYLSGIMSIGSKFKCGPVPAELGSFLQNYRNYLSDLKKTSSDTIQGHYHNVIEPMVSSGRISPIMEKSLKGQLYEGALNTEVPSRTPQSKNRTQPLAANEVAQGGNVFDKNTHEFIRKDQ